MRDQAGETVRVSFGIEGAYLAEIARDCMLSEMVGKAYRILEAAFGGQDGADEVIIGVLKGTIELTGDSDTGIGYTKDAPELESYRERLQHVYSLRFRSRGAWVRPIAVVTQMGPRDAYWASDQVGMMGSRLGSFIERRQRMETWTRIRASFYCGSNEHVVVANLDPMNGKTEYVIVEPCSEAPFWMKPPQDILESLKRAEENGIRLEERGYMRKSELRHEIYAASTEKFEEVKDPEETFSVQIEEQDEDFWHDDRRAMKHHLIGLAVREQAGDDVFDMTLKDGTVVQVPRAPFVLWATRRVGFEFEFDQDFVKPLWTNVACSGEKLLNDDPNHTDWMLGAGIDIDMGGGYKDNVMGPAYDQVSRIQELARARRAPEKKPRFARIMAALDGLEDPSKVSKVAVIVGAGAHEGIVGETVAVFPDANAERAKHMDGVKAVIVERGGTLAHLAIVNKGKGITIVRERGAVKRYPKGTRVIIDPAAGRVRIVE